MRILHIVNHSRRQNGNVHAAVDVACEQVAQGHDVTFCSGPGEFGDILEKNGVHFELIDRLGSPESGLRSLFMLGKIIQKHRPQVLHAHMVASALIAKMSGLQNNVPLITTVHNAFEQTSVLMAVGERVVAVSGAIAELIVKKGIPKRRVRTVLNGTIGSARHPPTIPATVEMAHPAVLYVGGMHDRKGLPELITGFCTAATKRPDLHLYLVGDGPDIERYKALVPSVLRGSIHFVGAIEDPRGYFGCADIFVLASRADPAPLVISEARSAGLGVIATAVDGIPELLENGKAGILIKPRCPEAVSNSLLDALSTPQTLRSLREASQFNIARLTLSRVARELHDVYLEVAIER